VADCLWLPREPSRGIKREDINRLAIIGRHSTFDLGREDEAQEDSIQTLSQADGGYVRSGRMREGGDTRVPRGGLSARVSWQGWRKALDGTQATMFVMMHSRRRSIRIFDNSTVRSIWGGKSPRWTLHVLRSGGFIGGDLELESILSHPNFWLNGGVAIGG